MADAVTSLVNKLFEIEAIKFGEFKLKTGLFSPVYFDLRVIISYPKIMKLVSDLMWQAVKDSKFDNICGVPYTALPIATCMCAENDIPMLIRRKEAKDYGTRKMVEGHFKENDVCLIVEDVITSGGSVLETVELMKSVGLKITDAVVLLDREQGGEARINSHGIKVHRILSTTQVIKILLEAGCINEAQFAAVKKFVSENQFSVEEKAETPKKKKVLIYKERANLCTHSVSKKLFNIMSTKQTNLVLSADVTNCSRLLELAESCGPHICALKTHVDILEDFDIRFTENLQKISQKHNFLLFEDRKYADIGNTVLEQYSKGLYRTSEWADIINAHPVPGPGVIQGLKEVGMSKGRGCLLVAQMSSSGNLATPEYTKAAVEMADKNKDFVIGFICQEKLSSDPSIIHMTPGIKLEEGVDSLGQRYLTPSVVIGEKGCDVIIVGRGITKAADPALAAMDYKEAGYKAYESLI